MLAMIEEVLQGITTGDARFELIDHEHIHDTKNHLTYHLYDEDREEPTHITHNDKVIAVARDFYPKEMDKLYELKMKLEELVTSEARAELTRLSQVA
jgi:hypothetical protein